MSVQVNCPSCGGPVQFQSSIALVAICPHCRSALIRKDLNIENLGKVAELRADNSVIQIGTRGEFQRVAFSVLGRIQLKYDSGYWNEWFLGFQDGKSGWLAEAMGEYRVSFQSPQRESYPPAASFRPGQRVMIGTQTFEVSDIEEASYASAEGELPSSFPLGKSATFVDLAGEGGRFATLDYSESPCLVYLGQFVDIDQLKLVNRRTLEA